MIVQKAVKMAKMMEIPIIGIVENMSYVECPNCDEKINVFGESKLLEVAKSFELNALGKIPMRPDTASMCDNGQVEDIDGEKWLKDAFSAVESIIS